MDNGLGAGIVEMALSLGEKTPCLFACCSEDILPWWGIDSTGKKAQVRHLACECLLLHFLISFPTPALDYQKIQAQFRWETRTNCLDGNHYAAHDSAPPHHLQEGDTLTLGVLGLLAEGKEQDTKHQEQQQQLRNTAWQTLEPPACAHPLGPGAARPVENVTQMFL